jgi:hypothetical protein
MPPVHLVAVKLHFSTNAFVTDNYSTATARGHIVYNRTLSPTTIKLPQILDGYLLWSADEPAIHFTSSTGREQLAGHRGEILQFWPRSDLFEVKYPIPLLVSTTSIVGLEIPITLVQSVEKSVGPFDGRTVQDGDLQLISPHQAALQLSGKPVYFCQVYGGETAEEILVSYNPEVNEAAMKPLCTKNTDSNVVPVELSDNEIESFARNKNVFVIEIVGD